MGFGMDARREGTAFIWRALTTIAFRSEDSRMLYRGFQYEAVLSIIAKTYSIAYRLHSFIYGGAKCAGMGV